MSRTAETRRPVADPRILKQIDKQLAVIRERAAAWREMASQHPIEHLEVDEFFQLAALQIRNEAGVHYVADHLYRALLIADIGPFFSTDQWNDPDVQFYLRHLRLEFSSAIRALSIECEKYGIPSEGLSILGTAIHAHMRKTPDPKKAVLNLHKAVTPDQIVAHLTGSVGRLLRRTEPAAIFIQRRDLGLLDAAEALEATPPVTGTDAAHLPSGVPLTSTEADENAKLDPGQIGASRTPRSEPAAPRLSLRVRRTVILLQERPPNHPITGPNLVKELGTRWESERNLSSDTLRSSVIPAIRKHGRVENDQGVGYWLAKNSVVRRWVVSGDA